LLTEEKYFALHVQVFKAGSWQKAYINIKSGRIDSLSYSADNVSSSVNVIDLGNYYLLPGLVDAHVHFSLNAYNLREAVDSWKDETATRNRVAGALRQFLEAGVTHVRDGGDAAGIGLTARRMVENEDYLGPRVEACGYAIYKKGRYGEFLGPGASSLEEVFQQIDEIAIYTGHLKICQSGIVSFKTYGHVGEAQFSLEELTKIVSYAHGKGLFVMAHASGPEAVEIAVKAKVDTIEHGYYLSEGEVGLMAEQGTIWVPTLSPLANLIDNPESLYPGADLNVIERAVEDQKSKIAMAYGKGVKIAVGTDAGAVGVPHGVSIYDEIEHMVSAGLSRQAVFEMACLNGREALGAASSDFTESFYGWKTGDAFDAVIYQKDPFKSQINLEDITAVYR